MYFKNEVASICEGKTVSAVTDGFTVTIVVLTRAWLTRTTFLSTLSHVSHVIVMTVMYDGLVISSYIVQSVSSLQAHEDRSSRSRNLSSLSYVTFLTNLLYFFVFSFVDDFDAFSIQLQYCSKEVDEDLLLDRHCETLGGLCLGCVWC